MSDRLSVDRDALHLQRQSPPSCWALCIHDRVERCADPQIRRTQDSLVGVRQSSALSAELWGHWGVSALI